MGWVALGFVSKGAGWPLDLNHNMGWMALLDLYPFANASEEWNRLAQKDLVQLVGDQYRQARLVYISLN